MTEGHGGQPGAVSLEIAGIRSPWRLGRIADLGSAAQASIPGLYAWAVTVAPAAWSRGAPFFAKTFAVLGLVTLAAALFLEHRRPDAAARARAVAVWGLSLTSAFTWLLVPAAMTTLRVDVARGLAGMLGWAMFGFACAAPPVRSDEASDARIVEGPPLRPRTRLARGDLAIMSVGAGLACVLQTVGWRSGPPERAILVRLVAVACRARDRGRGDQCRLRSPSQAHTGFTKRASPSGSPVGHGPLGASRRPARILAPPREIVAGDSRSPSRRLLLRLWYRRERCSSWTGSPCRCLSRQASRSGVGALPVPVRAEDLKALYWLVVGVVAVRAAVQIARPRGA